MTALVATHDPALIDLADRVLDAARRSPGRRLTAAGERPVDGAAR